MSLRDRFGKTARFDPAAIDFVIVENRAAFARLRLFMRQTETGPAGGQPERRVFNVEFNAASAARRAHDFVIRLSRHDVCLLPPVQNEYNDFYGYREPAVFLLKELPEKFQVNDAVTPSKTDFKDFKSALLRNTDPADWLHFSPAAPEPFRTLQGHYSIRKTAVHLIEANASQMQINFYTAYDQPDDWSVCAMPMPDAARHLEALKDLWPDARRIVPLPAPPQNFLEQVNAGHFARHPLKYHVAGPSVPVIGAA